MTLKDEIEKLIQQETKRLEAEGKKNAQAHQKIVAEYEKLTPLLKKLVSAIDPRFIEAEYHDQWACIERSCPKRRQWMTQEKILFLGPENSPLGDWLQEQEGPLVQTSEKITAQFVVEEEFTFLVSYGYRHILKKHVLDKFPDRAINLHISLLPWNRGADPNFWSFVENTPKGVTIHYLDEGVDTGEIIVQQEIKFDSSNETLATTYKKLHAEIQVLFKSHWNKIKNGINPRRKQLGEGSSHRKKDKEPLSNLLIGGWDTPVSLLEEYAAETQMSVQFWAKYDSELEQIRKQNKS